MSKRGILATLFAAALALTVLPVARANAAPRNPAGYRQTVYNRLAPGVIHRRMVTTRGRQVVNVAHMTHNAAAELRPVLARNRVAGSFEKTSSMCRRVKCIAAVNGDFFVNKTGVPIGGVAISDVAVRSPATFHNQLSVTTDGSLHAGSVTWKGTITGSDLQELPIQAVNIDRGANRSVLYSRKFGARTGTNRWGAELILKLVKPAGELRIGQTTLASVEHFRTGGNTIIPKGSVVLSAHGSQVAPMREFWQRVLRGDTSREALLRIDSYPDVTQTLGGAPVLVHKGKRWVNDLPSSFSRGRHPRTIVGWNPAGDVFLVTVDGRQPGYSVGMSLTQAANFMLRLGATEAINLDGGGSTTFVAQNKVMNRPSDGGSKRVRERSVAMALAIVPSTGGIGGEDAEAEDIQLTLPKDSAPADGIDPVADPASDPLAAREAVGETQETTLPKKAGAMAIGLIATNLAALNLARRYRRREA